MHVKAILFILSALLLFAMEAGADPFSKFDVETPKVRMDAPAFTLENLSGEKVSLVDYKGKVVLLNFWATWCGPCRHEMPGMQRLWERYREQGFVIIAVAADAHKRVAPFVEKLALSYPILFDPEGEVRNRYEVIGLPTSYLIGRDGKISGRVIGAKEWDSREADSVVTTLLMRNH